MRKSALKVLSMVFVCLLILTYYGNIALAGEAEFIVNGGLETLSETGLPSGWVMSLAKIGVNCEISKDAHGGEKAVRFYGDGQSLHMIQSATGLVKNSSYTLSAWLKSASGSGAAIKLEFRDKDDKSISKAEIYEAYGKTNNWEEKTIKFTFPEDAVSIVIMIRLVGGGDVIWDDISLKGEKSNDAKDIKIVEPVKTDTPVAVGTKTAKKADFKEKVTEKGTMVVGENGNSECIQNGSFEYVTAGDLTTWGKVVNAQLDQKHAFRVKDKVSGEYGLKFDAPAGQNVHALQAVNNVIGGNDYEISAWCKRNSAIGSVFISLMVYYENEELFTMEYANRPNLTFDDAEIGKWTHKTLRITLPPEATYFTVMVRTMNGGDVTWDDISVVGPKKVTKVAMDEYLKPMNGAENIIRNAGFEEGKFNLFAQAQEKEGEWFTRTPLFEGFYEITDQVARTGSKSLRLKFDGATTMPWFGQIVPVTPGVVYQFSAWVKVAPGSQTPLSMQADAYNGVQQTSETYIKDGQKKKALSVSSDPNEWQHVVSHFTAFPGTAYYALLLRVGADYPYEMYFDDIEFYPISTQSETIRRFEPDEVFYYSHWTGEGNAVLTTFADQKPELVGTPVRFRLKDGETVKKEEILTLDSNGAATFYYDLDLLSEKKKEYVLEATILDSSYNPTNDVVTRKIYKYDKPTLIDENMAFLDNGGKVVNYVLGQGTVEDVVPIAPEIGCTVSRAIGSWRTSVIEKLDIAQSLGLKATVTILNHEDANDPERIEYATKLIKLVKDHPALFGWYLYEEPNFNGDSMEMDEHLRIVSKLIRDLDPDHPIGSVVSESKIYGRLGKYNDYMDLDCYPAQIYDGTRPAYIAKNVAIAQEGVKWRKPISIMTQAFEWFNFFPNTEEIRNYIYQCFFEGGSGFSFHSLGGESGTMDDLSKRSPELWEGLKKCSQWEWDFMFKHFTLGEYPLFNERWTDDVRWRTVVVGDTIYAIVLNMYENKTPTADIKLESYDGSVKITGFTAELLAGGKSATIKEDSDTLTVSVQPSGAAVYKITPNEKVDLSGIKSSKFRDLMYHSWAREAIQDLEQNGMINSKTPIAFYPGENITRGDFALFLIRTLGLTADTNVSFDDVKPNAEYAKEVAIGKALGILNGVGDNKYNPEAAISRQDMMTIIARGMRLTDTGADLSAFSDSANISDYAMEGVKAMVSSGLVKGNADGTINPLGNTTRAEAAVIMYRILNSTR